MLQCKLFCAGVSNDMHKACMHCWCWYIRKHTPAAWIARLPTKAVATYILECKRVYCCNETNSITQHAVAAASSGYGSTCLTDWTVLIDGLAWREPMGPLTVHSREPLPLLPLRVSCEPWRSSGLAAFLASSSHNCARRIILYYCIIVLYCIIVIKWRMYRLHNNTI